MLSNEYVKKYFPRWDKFCVDSEGDPSEEILTDEIALAAAEFSEYLERTAETISEAEKLHLLNIVKYRLFNRMHGDTSFDNNPQFVKDYEYSLERLKKFSGKWLITANEKKFTGGRWFNEEGE